MYNITIVFTAHKENGNCNSFELCKIIESINPEIIFEELSIEAFDRSYNLQNLTTLETNSVKYYQLIYDIKHIPVVGRELNIDLKLQILTKNKDYCSLIERLETLEAQLGFQFLNSSICDTIFDKLKEVEQTILKEKNDEFLNQIIVNSDKEINRYENEIIDNIYSYSKLNKYDKAILFLGAAHKKSFMKKIHTVKDPQIININWTIYNN